MSAQSGPGRTVQSLGPLSRLSVRNTPCCRHCSSSNVRRRGLCWRCYDTPAIRRQYESTSPLGLRRPEIRGRVRPPRRPTDARPGSAEKVEVLCERAAARVGLWHPRDALGIFGDLL